MLDTKRHHLRSRHFGRSNPMRREPHHAAQLRRLGAPERQGRDVRMWTAISGARCETIPVA